MFPRLCLTIVAYLALATCLAAQEGVARIARGKAATAYIHTPVVASASAVCISADGIFVTTEQIAEKAKTGTPIRIVLDPHGANERELMARLLSADKGLDLAFLQVNNANEALPFLPLGDDASLYETMPVAAYGCERWGLSMLRKGDWPIVDVTDTQIISLRNKAGQLDRIQFESLLDAGNAGGALLDDSGQLIAIIRSTDDGAGVRSAIPVSKVREMFDRPAIGLQTASVPLDRQHDKFRFQFSVLPFLNPLRDAIVEVELLTGADQRRTFPARRQQNDAFMAEIELPADVQHDAWLASTLTYDTGHLVGRIRDRQIRVGEQALRLSNVKSIRWSQQMSVETRDGKKLVAPREPLTVPFDLGAEEISIDLAQAIKLELQPSTQPEPRIDLAIVVRTADRVIVRHEASLPFSPLAASPSPVAASAFTKYQQATQAIELPGISDIVLAADGRLLLVHRAAARKVAVYDVNRAAIVAELTLPSSDVRIAASKDKMVVADAKAGKIERWSLTTFQLELTNFFPPGESLRFLSLGYASDGPVLICVTEPARLAMLANVLELSTLEKRTLAEPLTSRAWTRPEVYMRAAPTGDVFSLWVNNALIMGLNAIAVANDRAEVFNQNINVGHVVPGYDGSLLFTGKGQIYAGDLSRQVWSSANAPYFIPTTHPGLYLSYAAPQPPAIGARAARGANTNVAAPPAVIPVLHAVANSARLVELPDPKLGLPAGQQWRFEPLLDKRLIYVPQASQLISVPYSDDRIVIQRFDLDEALGAAGGEPFFVQSVAPYEFRPGQTYIYEMKCWPAVPGIEYQLQAGPPGMTVSAAGEVRWDVPAAFDQPKVNVNISVRNGAGQSLLEKLTLTNLSMKPTTGLMQAHPAEMKR